MVLISITLSYIISLIAGLIILVWPKTLNYIIAVWLLLNGILGLVSVLL